MHLDLFNNIMNDIKENKFITNFIKELSKEMEKEVSNNITSLKQENSLYQVVNMAIDGAYLQNLDDKKVYKETDIKKEILDKIGNDTILRYKDGKYIIEEELTDKFYDSLVDINEYTKECKKDNT